MALNAKTLRRQGAKKIRTKIFLSSAPLRLGAFALMVLTLSGALAADPPAKQPKSLDDQLLDDLDADLLEGLPGPAKPAADPKAPDSQEPAAADSAGNPLAQIAERMRLVQQ